MKRIIDDICKAKKEDDEKCKQANLAIETMEQYLYTYLNHKYGLKSLVIDWATTIVNSVNVYSKEGKTNIISTLDPDPDVVVFGRILKNE